MATFNPMGLAAIEYTTCLVNFELMCIFDMHHLNLKRTLYIVVKLNEKNILLRDSLITRRKIFVEPIDLCEVENKLRDIVRFYPSHTYLFLRVARCPPYSFIFCE